MFILPLDIIVNHIIPYTYTIQSKLLLEDIQNYYTIKTTLMNDKYDTNIIKHDILAVFYDNKSLLNKILDRHFQIKFKSYDYNIIYKYKYKYSINTRFNILFGLFTKEERIYFLEYMIRDNGIWIIK
jgi:hypothetical protein